MNCWRLPGSIAAFAILVCLSAALIALLFAAPLPSLTGLLEDAYLHHLIAFSFKQASLSALIAVGLAIPIARALLRRHFPGKVLLLRLASMTLILPVLVAVFGLMTIYGREGWLAMLCHRLGIDYTFSPYGLSGILLAHVFFNLPLATRLLLQALQQIPNEQRQLADQLAVQGWNLFKFLEWPWLKRQLFPAFVLIFMLCFTSFAIVLTLGGGPQATTLELAIYQALNFDYDPGRAALLAIIQLCCCGGLLLCSHWLTPLRAHEVTLRQTWQHKVEGLGAAITDAVVLLVLVLFLIPPLIAVITAGIGPQTLTALTDPALWQALALSLKIAIVAGVLSVSITLMILWTSREYRRRQQHGWASCLEASAMLILGVPSIVLATGAFLILNQTIGLDRSPAYLVIIVNTLMALPYASKLLESPMRDLANQYSRLCLSLNLTGWQRLRHIELPTLRQPLLQAFAFASLMSMGDFGVIALFGSQDFQTLPYYLYQQMGAYRTQQAAVTALLLLLLCFLIFILIETLADRDAHRKSTKL
ncbi:thiamine/thiamine pyrophosphate ABC transporter permease [Rosenbergiella metrosideri]|uniref:thiamine/thiamine pyrophosphate ABC transporter permease n=1 Tax=Rosenbergiella metrosideri TaxID=2921185 RepID=UPI001F4F750D|nr:thiamine/thiamine pyrophosphate ABC transporter permease [Rosenbergiella metrosideri]